MKEKEFLKIYKERRGLKNIDEAKEKFELFWKTLEEQLLLGEKRILFKNWGAFEKKERLPRKVRTKSGKVVMSKGKTVINFRAGKGLREEIN